MTQAAPGFEIHLPLFEGPFDLLLFFIERDELDIYDIPIARITNEFNTYLKHLEALNVEVASEFILVAATLIRIKAKMLLPRVELDDKGNEIDPRADLVKHLLEYKKYKSILGELSHLEEQRLAMFERGGAEKELMELASTHETDFEMQSVDLFKLLRVFEKVMKRFETEQIKPVHTVYQYPYTIEEQRTYILSLVHIKNKVSFTEIISSLPNKIGVVFNFLAILELIQMQEIDIVIGEGFNNFWVIAKENEARFSSLI